MIIHKDKMLWYNTGYCIKVIKKDKEDLQEEYRKNETRNRGITECR